MAYSPPSSRHIYIYILKIAFSSLTALSWPSLVCTHCVFILCAFGEVSAGLCTAASAGLCLWRSSHHLRIRRVLAGAATSRSPRPPAGSAACRAPQRPPQRFDPGHGKAAPAGGAGQPPGVSAPRESARAPAGGGRGARCQEAAAQPAPAPGLARTQLRAQATAQPPCGTEGKRLNAPGRGRIHRGRCTPLPRPREIAPSPGAWMLGRGRVSSQPLVAVPGWEVGARSSDVSASETPERRVWWDPGRWLGCLFQVVSDGSRASEEVGASPRKLLPK